MRKESTLLAIVSNGLLKKSDAVILLEGDGLSRLERTIDIWRSGLAKMIVVSGGAAHQPLFTVPAGIVARKIRQRGVPQHKIIAEEDSRNTREQSVAVMRIIKKRRWSKIILVASLFHQPRAYMTFLRAMRDAHMRIQIFNAPVRAQSWFQKTSLGRSRLELLSEEFKKIEQYGKKGHLASMRDVLLYERWKERQT